ncbi:MAG: GWxTD domain-containing protein [Gemmatimonadetes bacterium]|nr:GWxTD domain-containing protein [Gemmatimonadota bacterium]MYG85467.1 GWxTD domain-containing protein [Gemmatimonadota bacterium]MYJ88208.1 GWxTD domain-containing protein [Gemmatimonadota bacterium]
MSRFCVLLVAALVFCASQRPAQALLAPAPVPASEHSVPENLHDSSLEAGKAHYEAERFREALAQFQQAIEEDGGSAPAHYWRGMAHYKLAAYRKAASSFKRTVKLDEKWASGYLGLGKSYLRIKYRILDARNALRMAARLAPTDPEIQYHLGIAHMNPRLTDQIVGGARDGRSFFLKATVLDPAHPDAFYQIGRCYERPESPEFDKAMAAYLSQFKVNPFHNDALGRFVYLALLTDWYGLAVELLEGAEDDLGAADDLGATDNPGTADDLGALGPAIIGALRKQFSTLSEDAKPRPDVLHEVIETYFSLIEPDEKEVYRDLAHVAPPDELASWQEAGGSGRDARWHAFWNARDSNPATVVNERLVEHYRRVMYARYHYSQGQHPYDRRGEIHVRFGAPEDRRGDVHIADRNAYGSAAIADDPAVDAVRERNNRYGYRLRVDRGRMTIVTPEGMTEEMYEAGGILADGIVASTGQLAMQDERKLMGHGYATESWVYARYGLELFFVDQFGGGRFDYPWGNLLTSPQETVRQELYSPRRLAGELIKRSPEEYRHDFGGEPLEYAFDAVSFRADNGATELDLSYSIPVWQFGDVSDGKGNSTRLEHLVTLRDSAMSPRFSHAFGFGPFDRPKRQLAESHVKVPVYTLPERVVAPSGDYTLAVQVRDETSQKIGVYRRPVRLSDYSGEELLISDLKLATLITPSGVQGPFVRNGLNITPNPGRLYIRENPVYVYYEVYNLNLDGEGKTAYEILYEISPRNGNERRGWSARGQGDMQTVMMVFSGAGYAAEDREYTSLDTSSLPAGEYVLTVTFTDLNAGSSVTKSANFLVMER